MPGEVSLIGNEYSELVKFSVPPSDDHADQRHTKRASRDAVIEIIQRNQVETFERQYLGTFTDEGLFCAGPLPGGLRH
ncbi:hypothetical protein ACI5FR_00695 [Paenibacillus sp. HJGM_3]